MTGFNIAPATQVQWSFSMDPLTWAKDSGAGVVKATACLNRFELLANGGPVDSEVMRKWAHEQLDAWLDKR